LPGSYEPSLRTTPRPDAATPASGLPQKALLSASQLSSRHAREITKARRDRRQFATPQIANLAPRRAVNTAEDRTVGRTDLLSVGGVYEQRRGAPRTAARGATVPLPRFRLARGRPAGNARNALLANFETRGVDPKPAARRRSDGPRSARLVGGITKTRASCRTRPGTRSVKDGTLEDQQADRCRAGNRSRRLQVSPLERDDRYEGHDREIGS
jgi:hypothetical protein